MPILPREPNWHDTEAQQEQALYSEMASSIVEDFAGDFLGFEEDEESNALVEAVTSQARLGEPNAPLLLDANVRLPAGVTMEEAARELAPLVENTLREGIARDIEDDYDEFVYIPLSMYTQKNKERKGLQHPATPLYGTGLLVQEMRPGGWLTGFKWTDDHNLEVRWGPTEIDDQHPSMKYRDMFFGNPGTGKGHKVKIPRRYPRVSNRLKDQVQTVIENWLRVKQASAAQSPSDNGPLWTY